MPQPINENAGSIDFEPTTDDSNPRAFQASITETLKDLRFPISKSELLSQAGERRLRFSNGQSIALFDLLAGAHESEFESAAAVASALSHPLWSNAP